jgi:hypothetical protein
MAKVVRLTENDVLKIVQRIIKEQGVSQSFQQGKKQGIQTGRQARQKVNQAVKTGIQVAKSTIIKIGKIIVKVIVIGVAILWVIGKAIYKVGEAIHNALMKFISATGKVVVESAKAIDGEVSQFLRSAGIAIEKGLDVINQQISKMVDRSIEVVKYIINAFKQFGIQTWAKILVAAAAIKEFGTEIQSWLKSTWGTIQSQIGVAWDQASSWASGKLSQLKKGAENVGRSIKQGAQSFASDVANTAGNIWGNVQGFVTEMFERFLNFTGTDTQTILREARKYNRRVIV